MCNVTRTLSCCADTLHVPLQVLVARVDSHELFRASQVVYSVIVLLRTGCHLPLPEQLSAALRSKRSLEDGLED